MNDRSLPVELDLELPTPAPLPRAARGSNRARQEQFLASSHYPPHGSQKQSLPQRTEPRVAPAWASPAAGFEPYESEFQMGMTALGFDVIHPQQWQVFDVCESHDENGRLTYGEVAIDIPRRSGKSESTTGLAIGRCLSRPGYRVAIVFCSTGTKLTQRWKMDVFERLRTWADVSWPVLKIGLSNGHEFVDFGNGSQILLLPPKGSAFRSEKFDLVIFDEAGEATKQLTERLLQAAGPTLDTADDPQMIKAGTPAEFRDGSMLYEALERGKADLDAAPSDERAAVLDDEDELLEEDDDEEVRHGIVKYGVADELTVEDVETWALARALTLETHPGVGTLTDLRRLRQRYIDFKPERYSREYLGQFGRDATTSGIINPGKWNAGVLEADLDAVLADVEHFALAIAVAFDQSWSAIAIAWRVDGVARIGLVAYERGSDWLPERVNELATKYPRVPIVYDAKGQVQVEVEKITQARQRTRMQRQSWLEVQTAAALLVREVHTGRLKHFDQEPLTQAALIASKRGNDASFAFGRPSPDAQIVAVEAASLALRMYDEQPVRRAPMRYVA